VLPLRLPQRGALEAKHLNFFDVACFDEGRMKIISEIRKKYLYYQSQFIQTNPTLFCASIVRRQKLVASRTELLGCQGSLELSALGTQRLTP
jgi:hypothetical protein